MTELSKPCGLPIATTSWPTRSSAASPSGAGSGRRLVGAQHGEIGERVGPDRPQRELAPVGERRAHAAAAAPDDVRRGEQEAVRRDHDAGAAAGPPAAADAQVRHGRRDGLGDERDDARVGVERLALVGHLRQSLAER